MSATNVNKFTNFEYYSLFSGPITKLAEMLATCQEGFIRCSFTRHGDANVTYGPDVVRKSCVIPRVRLDAATGADSCNLS